jgi:hypothetical protein
MLAAGLTPRGPLADYPTLYPVTSAKQAEALAVRMEDDCSSAWRALYAACVPTNVPKNLPKNEPNPVAAAPPAGLRAAAQSGLTDSAVRATRWRQLTKATPLTQPFPGL